MASEYIRRHLYWDPEARTDRQPGFGIGPELKEGVVQVEPPQLVDRGHERARLIVPDGEVGDLEPAPSGWPLGQG